MSLFLYSKANCSILSIDDATDNYNVVIQPLHTSNPVATTAPTVVVNGYSGKSRNSNWTAVLMIAVRLPSDTICSSNLSVANGLRRVSGQMAHKVQTQHTPPKNSALLRLTLNPLGE